MAYERAGELRIEKYLILEKVYGMKVIMNGKNYFQD